MNVIDGVSVGGSDVAALIASETIPAEGVQSYEVTIPASTTDQLVDVAFDVDRVDLVVIHTTQDVTLETNAPGPGPPVADTIILTANRTFRWRRAAGIVNPFTEDVTAFYLTNATEEDAVVRIRVCGDVTA